MKRCKCGSGDVESAPAWIDTRRFKCRACERVWYEARRRRRLTNLLRGFVG